MGWRTISIAEKLFLNLESKSRNQSTIMAQIVEVN